MLTSASNYIILCLNNLLFVYLLKNAKQNFHGLSDNGPLGAVK